MECKPKIIDVKESALRSQMPHVKLQDVKLQLGAKDILDGISVDLPYGKKLGIVGGTGSGKSVLLKSLVRIHDVSSGKITVDGHDVREYSLENLRSLYSYVFQDVFLFSNTIDSNIAYADPEIDDEAVFKAAKDAQAHRFITEFTDGYQTIVGERGIGISGGQKQRVAIARALLKNSPILIFDDSTSALDVNTEKRLLETIRKEYWEKTVIITAHRLSSVVDCDEIIYLKDGRISERGTFEELMQWNGDFAQVYKIQQERRSQIVDYDALAAE